MMFYDSIEKNNSSHKKIPEQSFHVFFYPMTEMNDLKAFRHFSAGDRSFFHLQKVITNRETWLLLR